MVDITDFQLASDVPASTITRYRGRVPDELIDIWQRHGYGSFGQGFFRVIDPDEHLRRLSEHIGRVQGSGVSIPIMVTGLADLICWEPDLGVTMLRFRNRDAVGLGTGLGSLLGLVEREGVEWVGSRLLDWDMYPKAVEAHGPLAFDESFTYVPLLSLGGAKAVERMAKRQTIPAIEVYVEFQGRIEH